MAVNYIQLTGNLLQPEVRTTQTGKTVIKAQMVVKTWGDDNEDMWVDVEAWENLANNVVASFPKDRKTMRVVVEGSLKKDVWDDAKTGEKRSRYLISANNIAVALDYQVANGVSYSGDGNSSGGTQVQTQNYQTPAPAQPVARPMSEIAEGDAPF